MLIPLAFGCMNNAGMNAVQLSVQSLLLNISAVYPGTELREDSTLTLCLGLQEPPYCSPQLCLFAVTLYGRIMYLINLPYFAYLFIHSWTFLIVLGY